MEEILRVLLVEDCEDDAELLLREIRKDGLGVESWRVETAEAMAEALEDGDWQVILADYNLPTFSAPEALKVLQERNLGLPFIVVSGEIGEEAAVQLMRRGAHDFVPKSNLSRLVPVIRRELKEGRVRREHSFARKELEQSEKAYRTLAGNLWGIPYRVYQGEARRIQYFNDNVFKITGYRPEELMPPGICGLAPVIHEEDRGHVLKSVERSLDRAIPFEVEYRIRCKDGQLRYMIERGTPVAEGSDRPVFIDGIIHDQTEEKEAEEQLKRSRHNLQTILDVMPFGVMTCSRDKKIRSTNKTTAAMLGYRHEEELVGKSCEVLFGSHNVCPIVDGGKTRDLSERVILDREGRKIPVMKSVLPIRLDGEEVLLEAMVDITDRKRDEQKIKQQLSQIQALRNIDMAITSSLDLRVTLDVILDNVTRQLSVDAADVLLLDGPTQVLEFAAERGFQTRQIRKTSLRLGEGLAGRVAKTRKPTMIFDFREAGDQFTRMSLVEEEGFLSYFGVPLLAKGHVKGVLEIFHRQVLEPENGWLDFLEALAGQAAIAIDNAALYNDLNQANTELMLAYESTIEGWARALDYRDRETEGHSRRVTEMTVRIAREMEVSNDDLVHVRRGALLHDIGKLGVPDSILLKPGKLNEEEWATMKKHPELAYHLLSPISHLRPALPIPYCHHEKWDGTGYPRGLKGEEIPLPARIFAVVDVWDALHSDRPYRPAWPREKVIQYLQDEAGSHFDPAVVDVFLRIDW